MRFCNSIFASLLKPLDRRSFKAIVARHQGDAYDKSFHSWDHLLALIFAQLSGLNSLRGVAAGWNANAHHHYHLGSAKLTRTTLADANARRPVGVFADTFALLAALADRNTRRDGNAMLRLIDSSPIPLGKLCDFATWNGRIRGLKMHAVYDPLGDRPTRVEVTLATVNDSEIGHKTAIEPGATPACAGAGSTSSTRATAITGWWSQIHDAGAWFVTRPKRNVTFRLGQQRPLEIVEGDGFRVLADREVAFNSKGDSTLSMPLRRIEIEPRRPRRSSS